MGWLVGEVHDGIAQMFQVIEHARMMVGTKAIATLSTGYLNALEYAKSRVQGADLTQMTDKAAPRVTITHHPDVRRSLMPQKAYAEGLRALYRYTATLAGRDRGRQGAARRGRRRWRSRSTTCCCRSSRASARSRSYALARPESLQTFGGSGFLQDYPIEQYVRDAKIDTLYEGTTASRRGLLLPQDRTRNRCALGAPSADRRLASIDQGRLKEERESVQRALDNFGSMVAANGRPASPAAKRTFATSTRSVRTPRGCYWPPVT